MPPTVEIVLLATDAISGALGPIVDSMSGLGRAGQELQTKLDAATAKLHDMEAAYTASAAPTQTQTLKLEAQRKVVADLSTAIEAHAARVKSASTAISQALALAYVGLNAALPALRSGFQFLEGDYAKLGQALHALPGPIGEIAGAVGDFLGQSIAKTIELTSQVAQLERATGMTAEQASTLIAVNRQVGISADTTINLMTRFARTLGGALDAEGAFANGGKGVAQILNEQGIASDDAHGKLLPLYDLLPRMADRFKALGPGAESTALSVKLFGREGAAMLPVLLQGSEGIQKLSDKAKALGLVMDQDTINATKRLKVAQRELALEGESLGLTLGTKLVPALGDVANGLNLYLENAGRIESGGPIFSLQRDVDGLSNAFQFLTGQLHDNTAEIQANAEAAAAEAMANVAVANDLQRASLDPATLSWSALVGETDAAPPSLERYNAWLAQTADMQKLQTERSSDAGRETYAFGQSLLALDDALHRDAQTMRDVDQAAAQAALKVAGLDAASIKAAVATGQISKAYADVTTNAKHLSEATQQLAKDFGAVSEGVGKLPEQLDKLAKARLAFELATGKTTTQEVERKLAAEALTKAYSDNRISLEQLVVSAKALEQASEEYKAGNPAAPFLALRQAGIAVDPALLKIAQGYREVEKASGTADQSMIGGIDSLHIVTTAVHGVTTATQGLSVADQAFGAVQAHVNQELVNAKWNLDNGKIGQGQYNDLVGQATKELGQATAALDAQKAAHIGTGAATAQGATAMNGYVSALTNQTQAQDAANKAVSDAKALYDKGDLSLNALVATQVNAKLVSEQYGAATEKAKKALDAAGTGAATAADGTTYYSRIVDTATGATKALATNIHLIPDAADRANERTGALNATLGNLPAKKQVDVSVSLPPEVGLHLFDTVKPTLPPEIGLHLFDNMTPPTLPINVGLPPDVTQHLFDNVPPPTLPPEITMHLFDNVSQAATGAAGGLLAPLQNAVQAQAGELSGVGASLMGGIATGMQSSTALPDAMTASIGAAIDATKVKFQIQSPSGYTAAALGEPLGSGIATGITRATPAISTSLNSIDALIKAAGVTYAGDWRMMWADLQAINTTEWAKVQGFFATVPAGMHDAGALAMQGLVKGMLDHEPEVINALDKIVQDALAKVKSDLGIHSPSAVFADVGHMSVAGFAAGITDNAHLISAAWAQVPMMSAANAMDFSAPIPLSVSGGSVSVTPTPNASTTGTPASGAPAGASFRATAPIHVHIGTHEIKSELADILFEAVNQGAF